MLPPMVFSHVASFLCPGFGLWQGALVWFWCGSGVVLVDQVSMDAAVVVVGVLLGGGFLVGCWFHHLDLIAQVIDHLQELCLQLQQG